jgi:hypothetical protein
MAEVGSVIHSRIPAGQLAADAAGVLGQPIRPHAALTRAIAAATVNLVDSADISEAARLAQDVAQHNAELSNSPNGPVGVPGTHPIINGIAELRQTEHKLAQDKQH